MTKSKEAACSVEKKYWTCNVAKHRHETEIEGNVCIKTRNGMEGKVRWTDDLLDEILEKHLNGESYESLGSYYGVGKARAYQVVVKAGNRRRVRHVIALRQDAIDRGVYDASKQPIETYEGCKIVESGPGFMKTASGKVFVSEDQITWALKPTETPSGDH